MIEIIERRLLSWDDHCTRNFSDLILEDIENAGMLPPSAEVQKSEKRIDVHGLEYSTVSRWAHGWEPEDE